MGPFSSSLDSLAEYYKSMCYICWIYLTCWSCALIPSYYRSSFLYIVMLRISKGSKLPMNLLRTSYEVSKDACNEMSRFRGRMWQAELIMSMKERRKEPMMKDNGMLRLMMNVHA